MSINIFSVEFAPISRNDFFERIDVARKNHINLRVATINPEYLLEAKKNKRFLESLKKADIKLVDGVGICLIARLRGVQLERLTGADMLPDLLSWAENNDLPVAIFNQSMSLSSEEDIRATLATKYPELMYTYNNVLPDKYSLILCTYGAPTQEFFLDGIKEQGIKIGIGGALDFLTDTQKRAPKIIRRFGLEWLWRLMLQPKRLKRIWNAVIIFPFQGIMEMLKKNHKR